MVAWTSANKHSMVNTDFGLNPWTTVDIVDMQHIKNLCMENPRDVVTYTINQF